MKGGNLFLCSSGVAMANGNICIHTRGQVHVLGVPEVNGTGSSCSYLIKVFVI